MKLKLDVAEWHIYAGVLVAAAGVYLMQGPGAALLFLGLCLIGFGAVIALGGEEPAQEKPTPSKEVFEPLLAAAPTAEEESA